MMGSFFSPRRSGRAIFRDRVEAGQLLATKLGMYAGKPDVLVLGLPRGGVPVAFEVSGALDSPLEIFLVRKLGVPGHEELAMGAIASGGVRVLNRDVIEMLHISSEVIEETTKRELQELGRRGEIYRGNSRPPEIRGRTAILVDDGLATGSTMSAAVYALRQQGPARTVVGVPLASAETCHEFRSEVDEIVCAVTPEPFYGVGMWYEDFSQTTDEEIQELLERAATRHRSSTEREARGRSRASSEFV
jgi:putative phosphoribosyl transferase